MFSYSAASSSGTCRLAPHSPLKGADLFDVADPDPGSAVWALQCSAASENVLRGGGLLEGAHWAVDAGSCLEYGLKRPTGDDAVTKEPYRIGKWASIKEKSMFCVKEWCA